MSYQNYIQRLCKSHGWELNEDLNKDQHIDKKSFMDYESKIIVPIPSDIIEKMYKESGPKENTTYHKVLEKKKK